MKVCIVSHYHFDISVIQARYLSESCDIHFIALFNEAAKNGDLLDISAYPATGSGFVNDSVVKEALRSNVGSFLDSVSAVSFFVFFKRGIKDPRNYFLFSKLASFIKKGNYDVVHIVGQNPLLIFLHIFLSRSPRVHNLHESTSHWNKETFENKLFLNYLAKRDIEIIFNSQNTQKRFIDFTGCDIAKCHTIYFGFLEHYRLFSKNLSMEKKSILFLGHIKSYKGVEYLIDALPVMVENIPDIKVVIAGRWAVPGLKERAMSHPNIVIIDKYLSSAEMTALLEQASLVVCPYTSASQSAVVTSAYAFFKPVVASNVEGLTEVIDEGRSGLLVPPRDSRALADAIIHILNDQTLYDNMSRYIAGLETDDRFSWKKNAVLTIEVYKKAINNTVTYARDTQRNLSA